MKTLTLIGFLACLVGVGLLVGSGLAYYSTQGFLERAVAASGSVVKLARTIDSDGDDTYAPVVSFHLKSGPLQTFTSSISSRPASYQPGETVEVLYDPAKPSDARIRSFSQLYILPLVLLLIGLPFTGAGIGLLVWQRRKAQAREWLKLNGQRRQATITQVVRDNSVSVNGRSPYRIACTFRLPNGAVRVYESDMLWRDPTPHIKGTTIEVLVDPNDDHRYWVDTSILPGQ